MCYWDYVGIGKKVVDHPSSECPHFRSPFAPVMTIWSHKDCEECGIFLHVECVWMLQHVVSFPKVISMGMDKRRVIWWQVMGELQ